MSDDIPEVNAQRRRRGSTPTEQAQRPVRRQEPSTSSSGSGGIGMTPSSGLGGSSSGGLPPSGGSSSLGELGAGLGGLLGGMGGSS